MKALVVVLCLLSLGCYTRDRPSGLEDGCNVQQQYEIKYGEWLRALNEGDTIPLVICGDTVTGITGVGED